MNELPNRSQFSKRRIAVLPFSNISPDQKDEYFADGVTDELISTLSKIRELNVISRTSVLQYKASGTGSKSVGEIGRELSVGAILEGSVRKFGNRVRITIQLIDAETDQHIWSETFDKELEDIFAIQSEIAVKVADALRLRLLEVDRRHVAEESTKDSEAYVYYLKGRFFWNKRTTEWLYRGIEQFRIAIEKDPSFAIAYSGLADCYAILGRRGDMAPSVAYPKAKECALKALELDDRLAEPHATLGAILSEYECRWKDAEKEFQRAIEINPSYAMAHNYYCLYLGHVGRSAEGIVEAKARD